MFYVNLIVITKQKPIIDLKQPNFICQGTKKKKKSNELSSKWAERREDQREISGNRKDT